MVSRMTRLPDEIGHDEPPADESSNFFQRNELFAAEFVIGLAVAALVLWVLVAAVSEAEFVYQGF